jgi:hypothetical protein
MKPDIAPVRFFVCALVLMTILLGNRCQQPRPDDKLWGAWTHAHEETRADGARSYRPKGYKLPPSRGRHWFEIKADGTFIDHPIAAGDGSDTEPGTWKALSATRLQVTLQNGLAFEVEVVALETDQLWLRWHKQD